jgi:hypothetical protein
VWPLYTIEPRIGGAALFIRLFHVFLVSSTNASPSASSYSNPAYKSSVHVQASCPPNLIYALRTWRIVSVSGFQRHVRLSEASDTHETKLCKGLAVACSSPLSVRWRGIFVDVTLVYMKILRTHRHRKMTLSTGSLILAGVRYDALIKPKLSFSIPYSLRIDNVPNDRILRGWWRWSLLRISPLCARGWEFHLPSFVLPPTMHHLYQSIRLFDV